MNLLAPLAALLGIEVEAITERLRNIIIANAIIVVLALAGLGFLVAAGFLALAEAIGPIYAALIMAAVFLAAALAVYLMRSIAEGRHKRLTAEKRRSTEASAFVTTAALTALPAVLRSPLARTIGIPAAALAAYFMLRNNKNDH